MHHSDTSHSTPPRSRDGAFFLSPPPEGWRPAPSSLKLLDVGKRRDPSFSDNQLIKQRYHRLNIRALFSAAFNVPHEKQAEEGMPTDKDLHWYGVADEKIEDGENRIVACCAVRGGVLSDVCVSPERQRDGLGPWMLEHLPEQPLVARTSAEKVPFYEAVGFKRREAVDPVAYPAAAKWEQDYPDFVWMERQFERSVVGVVEGRQAERAGEGHVRGFSEWWLVRG